MTTSGAPPSNAPAIAKAIDVIALSKAYKERRALSSVDLTVHQGELFAVIGPHGAGKTTLCNLLAGISKADSGSIAICGQPVAQAKRSIGYLTQHFSLYTDLSIDENIKFAAAVRGVDGKVFEQRKERLLNLVGLSPFRGRLAGRLSGGMKQKLALCCALVSQPLILILDEPTTGLDPLSRREFWHLLSQVSAQGTTTLVATPQFDEAELCQRVALIYHGVVHDIGTPAEMRTQLEASCLRIETPQLALAHELLSQKQFDAVLDVQTVGGHLEVLAKDAQRFAPTVELALRQGSIAAATEVTEPTLEHVFLTKLRSEGFSDRHIDLFHVEPKRTPSVNNDVPAAIMACDLTKSFGNFTAVNKLSLRLDYGEIYGLLGANGAGKTTTIQMLSGLTEPTSGTFAMAGIEFGSRIDKNRQKLGYMSQKFSLYDDLTVEENLDFYAAAYSLTGELRRERIGWVIDLCQLHDSLKTPVHQLPQGVRQWMAFAVAVMHHPEIVILDEPTAGLDPLARRQLWRLIRELSATGCAVLVTTHFLNDAEYCTRLGLMVDGSLVAEGTPSEIRASERSVLELKTANVHEVYDALSSVIDVSLMSCFPGRLHVQSKSQEEVVEKLAAVLQSPSTVSVKAVSSSLEDAFVSIIQSRKPSQ